MAIGAGWAEGAWVDAGWVVGAWEQAVTPSAVISGTAVTGGVLESEIVTGGETIVITLVQDTWVAAGATFNAQRQAIIDGLDAAEVEATGWNAEVRDKEVVTAVERTSDTVVTITLSAAAAYAITADETITVTIPAAALTAAGEVTGAPTFDVTNEAADDAVTASGPARQFAGTAWNKDWATDYGPEAAQARKAKRRELQRAARALKEAPKIEEIAAVQSLVRRSLPSELMKDENTKTMIMLAYYEYVRYQKRLRDEDERAAEILLLL